MQKLKDILVYIDDGVSNKERVVTAVSLAKLHNARLTAVTLAGLKPSHVKAKDAKTLATICEQEAHKRVDEFSQIVQEQELEVETRVIHGDENVAARKIAQYARNFDLVILRQANPNNDNHPIVEKVSEQVILLSGRPVFFMPYIGAHRIPCKKAAVAWDGTPAASRALHDALPLLAGLDEVMILIIEGKKKTARGELLVNDLTGHLKSHGVNAVVNRQTAGAYDVPTVILNEISNNDIDVLVMGG